MAVKLDAKWGAKIDKALSDVQEIKDFLSKCALCGMDVAEVHAMLDEQVAQLRLWKQHFFTPLQDGRSPDAAS